MSMDIVSIRNMVCDNGGPRAGGIPNHVVEGLCDELEATRSAATGLARALTELMRVMDANPRAALAYSDALAALKTVPENTMSSSRHDRTGWTCRTCGYVVEAQVSRIQHVFNMHANRCAEATPAERETFKRTKHWPKKKEEVVTP